MSLATLLAAGVLPHDLARHRYALLFAASVVEGPLVTVLAANLPLNRVRRRRGLPF